MNYYWEYNMLRLVHWIFWGVIFIVAILALPVIWKLALLLAKSVYLWFGIIGFTMIYYIYLRNKLGFFQTLDHELSHTIVSLCFGNRMIELHVHDRMGGHIIYEGRGHVLISLAPYFLRIPMLVIVPLSLLVQDSIGIHIIHFLAGILFAYSYISILEEAHPYQTDLTQNGLLFSYSAIIALNILYFGLMISIFLEKVTVIHFITAVFRV